MHRSPLVQASVSHEPRTCQTLDLVQLSSVGQDVASLNSIPCRWKLTCKRLQSPISQHRQKTRNYGRARIHDRYPRFSAERGNRRSRRSGKSFRQSTVGSEKNLSNVCRSTIRNIFLLAIFKMKYALLLFGISYKRRYIGRHTGGRVKIDFHNSSYNYKEMLLDYFHPDVFLSTYPSSATQALISTYKPVDYTLTSYPSTRNNLLLKGLRILKDSGNAYDQVIATRFDLLFKIPFKNVTINQRTINLVTRLGDGLICDNLYIFPYGKVNQFIRFLETTHKQSHYWENDLKKIFQNISFFMHDPTWVGGLKFYKIVRNRI